MNQDITKLTIATRKSQLAIWQTEWVANKLRRLYPDLTIELLELSTKGDEILDKSLAKIGGKGLFVKELEQAMLDNKADIAVHSLKDMPAETTSGLELAVYCEREDNRDVFISREFYDLASLPLGAKIGTSSVRRMAQLKIYRPDLEILPLRGNINTRIDKAMDSESGFDGIILAAAGVKRLNKTDLICQYLPIINFLPAPGQGVVVVQTRKADTQTKQLLANLACHETSLAVRAERAFNRVMGGSCQVPLAAFAEMKGKNNMVLHGQLATPDGKQQIKTSIEGDVRFASDLGERLAEKILNLGGSKILADLIQ